MFTRIIPRFAAVVLLISVPVTGSLGVEPEMGPFETVYIPVPTNGHEPPTIDTLAEVKVNPVRED